MGNSYSIYRFGHHDLRDNINYQLFISIPKGLYITVEQDSIAKVKTIKQEIEDDRLDKANNKYNKEENLYQNIWYYYITNGTVVNT